MKRVYSGEEIEALCESAIREFLRASGGAETLCVDIGTFAEKYLGLSVVYDDFAESGAGCTGFLADGMRAVRVRRNGGERMTVYPRRTAVIGRMLLQPGETVQRRFVLARESARDLLAGLGTEPVAPVVFPPFRCLWTGCVPNGTGWEETVSEELLGRAAAWLLMPLFLVERVMVRYGQYGKIIIHEGTPLARKQGFLLQRMADDLGVSRTVLVRRLSELGLYEIRPVNEYMRAGIRYGGVLHAAGE